MVAVETLTSCVDVALEEEPVEILSPKVIELKSKIHDETYLNNAIQRIAQVISKKLVENPEELKLSS
ncbi:MAG: hypothetical protein J6X37_07575 [Treponema sp.]|uniref:hypothetical protein n=1 Tax=Treponema sp. TaxID=166 RepID=UPI001B761EC6|nr:hypothetical protein [Treponema sp.]MBP5588566.1 hypothetical protein [Treponema sp.]MCR5385870.1 hypothetical protein [Treponema sp.]